MVPKHMHVLLKARGYVRNVAKQVKVADGTVASDQLTLRREVIPDCQGRGAGSVITSPRM